MKDYNDKDELDDIYYGSKKRGDDERLIVREKVDFEPEDARLQPKKVVRSVVRDQDEIIDPIKRLPPNIIGTLFERVDFLKTRIEEIRRSAQVREKLHKEMVNEILEDIKEKEEMEMRTADVDEKRNLKLDISMLRKEKRTENIRYWKDMMELTAELRELLERLETESNVSRIFRTVEE